MSDEIIDQALNAVNEPVKQELNPTDNLVQAFSGLAQNIYDNLKVTDKNQMNTMFGKILDTTREMVNSSAERTSSKSSRKPKHVKFHQELPDEEEEEEEWEDLKQEEGDDEEENDEEEEEAMNEYDTEWSAFHRVAKAHLALVESFAFLLKKYEE